MSDYLTHLAARALGVAETARPRRAIFEPLRVGPEPLLLEADAAPEAPAEPVQSTAAPTAPLKSPPARGRASTKPAPAPEAKQEPSRPGVPRRVPGRALRAAQRVSPAPGEAAEPRREAAKPRAPGPPPKVEAPRSDAVSREPSPPPASPERAEPPLFPLGARPPRPVVLRKEAESPTVRVTIGRVDVRAVTAEQRPEPKKPSQTPRMSLEEYLRRPREASR